MDDTYQALQIQKYDDVASSYIAAAILKSGAACNLEVYKYKNLALMLWDKNVAVPSRFSTDHLSATHSMAYMDGAKITLLQGMMPTKFFVKNENEKKQGLEIVKQGLEIVKQTISNYVNNNYKESKDCNEETKPKPIFVSKTTTEAKREIFKELRAKYLGDESISMFEPSYFTDVQSEHLSNLLNFYLTHDYKKPADDKRLFDSFLEVSELLCESLLQPNDREPRIHNTHTLAARKLRATLNRGRQKKKDNAAAALILAKENALLQREKNYAALQREKKYAAEARVNASRQEHLKITNRASKVAKNIMANLTKKYNDEIKQKR